MTLIREPVRSPSTGRDSLFWFVRPFGVFIAEITGETQSQRQDDRCNQNVCLRFFAGSLVSSTFRHGLLSFVVPTGVLVAEGLVLRSVCEIGRPR